MASLLAFFQMKRPHGRPASALHMLQLEDAASHAPDKVLRQAVTDWLSVQVDQPMRAPCQDGEKRVLRLAIHLHEAMESTQPSSATMLDLNACIASLLPAMGTLSCINARSCSHLRGRSSAI